MTIHHLNAVCDDRRTTLAVLAGTHALVDACCAALVFSLVHVYPLGSGEYLKMIIVYNVLAFAVQPLCGLLTDRFLPARSSALLGIVFTALAGAALLRHPWLTVVLAGMRNALYHVGGGVAALTMEKNRAAPVFTRYSALLLNGTVLLPGILISTATLFAGLRMLPAGSEGYAVAGNRAAGAEHGLLLE